ncbi:MAG TPA: S41 family peptidase [Xanthomonadaceae bacterium]|nr:S41 family peptidase [Xanthomonadaceae bacterium]
MLRTFGGIALFTTIALGLATPVRAEDGFDAAALAAKAASLLRTHYVDAKRGDEIATAIERKAQAGAYAALDREAFAQAITRDLRSASDDGHLYVRRNDRPPPRDPAAREAAERAREAETNHGFTEVRVLPGNVGYLRIVEFMHPQRSFETANAAMRFLQDTRALILDLRGNGGGYGGLPEYLATFYFDDEPQLLSSVRARNADTATMSSWTFPAVAGTRRTGTPAYVLVDGKTASAAEWLAYTLQAFGKAKVVGEPSAGGANHNEFFELDPQLRLSVSVTSPISAATGGNWEGKGVIPDVPSASAQALDTALQLARP